MKTTALAFLAAISVLVTGCESSDRTFLVTYEAQMKSNQITRGSTVLVSKRLDKAALGTLVSRIEANPAINKDGVVILMAIELER